MKLSAGILPYRFRHGRLEVLIGHPGGPLWEGKDEGAWSVIKGEVEPGEDLAAAARREFREETGVPVPDDVALIDLGEVRQAGGKVVHGFAAPLDLDPAAVRSNTFTMEWPPRSGDLRSFPEIDRVAWVDPDTAGRLLNPAQRVLVERLRNTLDHRE